MSIIDHDKFRGLVTQLYATVNELEAMFPGRHFTPDGHMVGSLGECLVADAYNLELKTASNKGYDAVTETGVEVEIKATQSNSVAFRSQPQHAIIIKILRDGTFEEIYNGPGALFGSSSKVNGYREMASFKSLSTSSGNSIKPWFNRTVCRGPFDKAHQYAVGGRRTSLTGRLAPR
ncbi:DUF6998 domain-containing protein [Marinobacter similis]|uniref:DUF6998 domain-containing protein n=1 Tax=Marinobacter similis TaxID=1420916 RepID=UPI001F42203E|nr:hypothetical protein [Marinobacter similis]